MGLILDRMQLCQALGVSDSSITAWEKKGLPVVRRGRGRGRKSLYNFDVVKRWCDQTGHAMGMAALERQAARSVPLPAENPGALARATLNALAEAIEEAANCGYTEVADASDLADIAGIFGEKLAAEFDKIFGAGAGEATRAALDIERGRPETVDQAVAHFRSALERAEDR